MKKIIVLLTLIMTTVGCALFDGEEWREYKEDREERGVNCYGDYSGYFYCEDKYGNRVY